MTYTVEIDQIDTQLRENKSDFQTDSTFFKSDAEIANIKSNCRSPGGTLGAYQLGTVSLSTCTLTEENDDRTLETAYCRVPFAMVTQTVTQKDSHVVTHFELMSYTKR